MTPLPQGRFEVVTCHRPVALVADAGVGETYRTAPSGGSAETPYAGPGAAVEVDLAAPGNHRVEAWLAGPDGTRLAASLDGTTVSLRVTTPAGSGDHRSRRHGRTRRPEALALTLTGTHLTAFTRESGRWVARARTDLNGQIDTRDPAWLAGLVSGWNHHGTAVAGVSGWRAGRFGQLGLRDVRLVTRSDGTPYRPGGQILLSATSAGPGFFATAHTSLWRLDPTSLALEHASDLWFSRSDRPGVYGDHASHVVRTEDGWLVATSTWGDFVAPEETGPGFRGSLRSHLNRRDDPPRSHLNRRADPPRSHLNRRADPLGSHLNRRGGKDWVDVTIAETDADLLRGSHVLTTRPLPLPTDGLGSVGVWDPHLVRTADGWLVGFVSARRWFEFHPAVAHGPSLDDLTLHAATTDRTATEGTTLWQGRNGWQVLASDGPDNPRGFRRRYPIFDLDLREVGTVPAPYFSNIGWPTLVPPLADEGWLMLTFDGETAGGPLPGYGTHGNLLVLQPPRH